MYHRLERACASRRVDAPSITRLERQARLREDGVAVGRMRRGVVCGALEAKTDWSGIQTDLEESAFGQGSGLSVMNEAFVV